MTDWITDNQGRADPRSAPLSLAVLRDLTRWALFALVVYLLEKA